MKLKQEWIQPIRLLIFDFDGVFTDNRVWVFEDGRESVCCSRSDGLGITKLKAIGLEVGILSTERNPVVTVRAQKLGLPCWQGVENKLEILKKLAQKRQLSLSEIAYVGNDINDQECLESVGLPLVVADAHPDVLHLGKERTIYRGGEGAVREICEAWCVARHKLSVG